MESSPETSRPSQASGHKLGLSAILIMSTVPIVIKYISVDPWVIGFFRLLIATTVMYAAYPTVRRLKKTTKGDWFILMRVGVIFGLHWITYFYAIKLGSPTIAVVSTISFFGIFSSTIGSLMLGYPIKWFHIVALLMSIVGTVMIGGQFEVGSSAFLGLLSGVASGCLYGILPVYHQRAEHLDSTFRSWGQFLGAFVVFIFCIPLGHWEISSVDYLGMIYLGLLGTVGAHTLWVHAVSTLPTTSSSILSFLYIPLAAIWSYLLLGEELNTLQSIGILIIISASLLGVFGKHLSRGKQDTPPASSD